MPFDYFFINADFGGGFRGLLVHKTDSPEEDIVVHMRKEDENGRGYFTELSFSRTEIKKTEFTFMGYGNLDMLIYFCKSCFDKSNKLIKSKKAETFGDLNGRFINDEFVS